MPSRKSSDPVSLAISAMQHVALLAQRGADGGRVEREVEAIIFGWIEAGHAGAMEAIEVLRDQLSTAAEETAAQVDDLDREDAAGRRAGQRVIACWQAARDAARAAMAGL